MIASEPLVAVLGPALAVLDAAPPRWQSGSLALYRSLWQDTALTQQQLSMLWNVVRELHGARPPGHPSTPSEPWVEWVQQCLMDPHAVNADQRSAAQRQLDERAVLELTLAAGLFDGLYRAQLSDVRPVGGPLAEAASTPAPRPSPPDGSVGPDALISHHSPGLAAARRDFYRSTGRASIDPVSRELVRLHSANSIDCGLCRRVRVRSAVDAGLDESTIAGLREPIAAGVPQAGTTQTTAALALAEAFGSARETVRSERVGIQAALSRQQIAEVLIDLVKWRSSSLVTITYGLEPPGEGPIFV